jgi:hypothetical protein
VPVLLFSLFPTKLGSYIAPAFPGAALVIARAGSRGLLDDRRARLVLAACGALVFASAFVGGALLFADGALDYGLIDAIELHRDPAAIAFGIVLVILGALGGVGLPRLAGLDAARAHVATAIATGIAFACGFHAVAAAMPTMREVGRQVAGVPGARLIEFSLKPSLFFYADAAGGVTLATVNGVVDPFVDRAEARRLLLTREDALALLREDAPTFALIDEGELAVTLARDGGAEAVSQSKRYVLLANPAAQRALAASPTRSP